MTNGNNNSDYLFYAYDVSNVQVGYRRTMQGHQGHTDQDKFINHIANHYNDIKDKLTMLSGRNGYAFDPDGMQECIIRCYTAIKKKGFLKDTSDYGIEAYLVRSYVNYVKEMKRACVNSKRDHNITNDAIADMYDTWYNDNYTSAQNKIQSDLFKDFSCLYLMTRVEDEFDAEHFYLFRLKMLCDITYKQLSDMTKMKGVRQKVVEVKKWLQDNVTKEEINNAFYRVYGNLIC